MATISHSLSKGDSHMSMDTSKLKLDVQHLADQAIMVSGDEDNSGRTLVSDVVK